LKIIFLESGGGWVPYWLERMDEHHKNMGWVIPDCKLLPSDYFRRQCLIQIPSDESTTPMLVELLGDDHIVWGTDYPHFDCNWTGSAKRLAGGSLAADSINKILGLNAMRFFNLEVPKPTMQPLHVMA
jgi:predicted TIM-barrel fold metal-dependent hydrolase